MPAKLIGQRSLQTICRWNGRYAALIIGAIAALLLAPGAARAELATMAEMEQVCGNWLKTVVLDEGDWAGADLPAISGFREIRNETDLLGICFDIAPEGFVVTPVLKELPPVKCYSQRGYLEFDDTYGIAALLRDVLADRSRRFKERYGSLSVPGSLYPYPLFSARNREAWEILSQSETAFGRYLTEGKRSPREQVGPLLTTAWHQTAPYNIYCPMGDGGQCVVWCVATALAQILWYHQWPPAGFGHTSYMWNGDQSCGGSTPGRLLVANFSDRFYYDATVHNAAEMSHEVGKSYNVDYGVCYSIGYAAPIFNLLPDNFGYSADLNELHRSDYTPVTWFTEIQQEINADRPIDYLIYNHMIVADGWATVSEINYYHMNYGWGGSQNAWYAIDNLYCTWPGCDPMVEVMWTNIIPDRGIMFYADTIAGTAPLTVNFASTSDREVDAWIWDFGDGDSAFVKDPVHTFSERGIYDVSLQIDYGDSSRSKTRSEYIYVLDDTVSAGDQMTEPGAALAVDIYTANLMPLSMLEIPVCYGGVLDLTYDSCSVSGCRTESFQSVAITWSQPEDKILVFTLTAWLSGYSEYPFLAAGEGPVLRLYFTVAADALPTQTTTIATSGFGGFFPVFYGSIYGFEHTYIPVAGEGTIEVETPCGDADGNGVVNVSDAVHLIAYIFAGGPPPLSGDVDCDELINISDAVYLVAFIFAGGPEPCAGC